MTNGNLSHTTLGRDYIPEAESTKYPLIECREPLTAFLKQKSATSLVVDPIDGSNFLYVRQSVSVRLIQAAKLVHSRSEGRYKLKIIEGFRCINVQKKLWNGYWNVFEEKNPHLSHQDLWQEVTQYVADPSLCPPHCTGGAVDVTLVQSDTLEEVEIGSLINDVLDPRCWTGASSISETAFINRSLLLNTMEEVGFCNMASEWWHYSFGDQYYAACHELPHAIYGPLSLKKSSVLQAPALSLVSTVRPKMTKIARRS